MFFSSSSFFFLSPGVSCVHINNINKTINIDFSFFFEEIPHPQLHSHPDRYTSLLPYRGIYIPLSLCFIRSRVDGSTMLLMRMTPPHRPHRRRPPRPPYAIRPTPNRSFPRIRPMRMRRRNELLVKGFEPPTYGLQIRCSTVELHQQFIKFVKHG